MRNVINLVTGLVAALAGFGSAFAAPADPAVEWANLHAKGSLHYTEGVAGLPGRRLHYVEAGQGPLIILYHGFPSFWLSWFDQMEMLKDRYRVVAVDAQGVGLSDSPKDVDSYTVENLAEGLDGFATSLNGDRPFILIGHDWGAALAFAYAQAYPHRLAAVIGLSAPPANLFLDLVMENADQQARSQYMQFLRTVSYDDIRSLNLADRIGRQSYKELVDQGDIAPDRAQQFYRALSDVDTLDGGINWYRANIPSFKAITATQRWPEGPPKLAVPALLIWGENDRTFIPEFITTFQEANPSLRVARLPGVGHWASMQSPALANDAISLFLDDVGSNSSLATKSRGQTR